MYNNAPKLITNEWLFQILYFLKEEYSANYLHYESNILIFSQGHSVNTH